MSTKDGHLDITRVGNEDLETLANKIEDFYKQDSAAKNQLSYNWDRNHMMVDGKQWLKFDGSREAGGVWKSLTVNKANEYIPRPTTNYIFDVYQTLKSYMLKNKPRSSVTPNTQSSRNKSAAKIGNLILETNWERLSEQENYEYAASCLIMYGTVFKKSYWDSSSLMMAKVPRMETVPDPMTGGMREIPAIDPETGDPIVDEIPLGDVNSDVVEPHRMAIDPLATGLHKARWVMEYSIQPIDFVTETFDKQEDGYTGLVSELKPEKKLSGPLSRFVQLKNSSGVKSGFGSVVDGVAGSEALPENSVVLKEYYERPTAKHPKGRLVVVANSITLYAGESPCEGPDVSDWHPYSECRWELVPGRFWGKGPLDDGVEVQKSINSIDSVIVLTRKTMAIPQRLIPTGSGVERGYWTGRPGLEIPFRADPSGAKPETIMASGVDAQVFQERAQRLEDLKQITGAIDILKGDRPPGVTAASALNLLYEVGTGKLYPILDRWKKFVENDQKKQLRLVAKKYKEPRPEFIKMLMNKNRELSPEAIDHFIGEDLYDNCNVVVEAGSNIPKLQAAKQAALQEAAATGVLGLELPANRAEYQRQMGLTGFDNDVGPDLKRAEWENDLMDDMLVGGQDNQPVILAWDKHEVHIEVHTNRMKEPSFMDLPQEVQMAYQKHVQEHEDFQNQAMQAQAMQAMAMGVDPATAQAGAQGQDPNTPKPSAEKGSGATKEQKNALHSDIMQPAPIGGKK